MSKEAEVREIFESSFSEQAPLHVLVNNAARFVFGEVRPRSQPPIPRSCWAAACPADVPSLDVS